MGRGGSRRPRQGDVFGSPSEIGTAEGEPRVDALAHVAVAPQTGTTPHVEFQVYTPIVYRYADQVRGDVSRPIAYVPEVSVTLDRAIEYAPARTPLVRQVRVELRSAATSSRDVRVSLKLPAGLRADSATRTVALPEYGAVRSATFVVRGELPPGRHTIAVAAEANGKRFTNGYTADRVRSHSPAAAVSRRDGGDRGGGPQGPGGRGHRVHPGRRRQLGRDAAAARATRHGAESGGHSEDGPLALQRDRGRHARVRIERRARREQRRPARLREARRDDGGAVRAERDAEPRASCRSRSSCRVRPIA